MVNQTAQSLIAEYLDEMDEAVFIAPQSASRPNQLREQSSHVRFATEQRYSRRRSGNASAPRGPRRRLHKPNGL